MFQCKISSHKIAAYNGYLTRKRCIYYLIADLKVASYSLPSTAKTISVNLSIPMRAFRNSKTFPGRSQEALGRVVEIRVSCALNSKCDDTSIG